MKVNEVVGKCVLFLGFLSIKSANALSCEQSTNAIGRQPSRKFDLESCKTYQEFQNFLIGMIDKERGENISNDKDFDKKSHRSNGSGRKSESLSQTNTEGTNPACITVKLQVTEVLSGSDSIRYLKIEVRDCIRLTDNVLDTFSRDPLQNINCKAAISLEDYGKASVSGTRFVCVCTEDDCNTIN